VKVFVVKPNASGDDTANLQKAFAKAIAAGPGSTVQLVTGDYHIGLIEVNKFDGYFKGAGVGKTIIHTLQHMDCQAVLDQNALPALMTFRLGNPRISDLTLFFDEPEPCATYASIGAGFWGGTEGNDITGLLLVGSKLGPNFTCDQLAIPEKGKGAIQRIEVKTGVWPDWDTTKYLNIAVSIGGDQGNTQPDCLYWAKQLTGDYLIADSIFNYPYAAYGINTELYGGTMRILNNTTNGSIFDIVSLDANGTVITISGNTLNYPLWSGIDAHGNNRIGFTTQPPSPKTSTYLITNNTITVSQGSTAMEVLDAADQKYGLHRYITSVTHNKINMSDAYTWGIWAEGIDFAQVSQNQLKGSGYFGIVMNISGDPLLDYWEDPANLNSTMKYCLVNKNDLSQMVIADLADPADYTAKIYLGPKTTHCTVIGTDVTDAVLDLGTGNKVVNASFLSAKSLPAALQGQYQKRLDQMKHLKGRFSRGK